MLFINSLWPRRILAGLFLTTTACTYQTQQSTTQAVPFQPLSKWQERVFGNRTHYSIIESNGQTILKAHSKNSASMIYQPIKVDLNKTPYINWQWKITRSYSNIEEKTRQGDDYVARVYIAVKGQLLSIFPRALNYVWSSNSTKLSSWPSPYSTQAVIFALQDKDSGKNQWFSEKRHLKQDLKTYFKEDFNHIEGIAIMTDSDNSQAEALSFYKNLFFSAR